MWWGVEIVNGGIGEFFLKVIAWFFMGVFSWDRDGVAVSGVSACGM